MSVKVAWIWLRGIMTWEHVSMPHSTEWNFKICRNPALHGNTSSISSMATSLPGSLVSAGLKPEKASLLWAWLSCLIPHGAPSGRGRPPTTPPSPPAYHSWLIMSHRVIAILSEFQTMAIPDLASLPALPGLPAVPIWSNHIISADQEKRSQRKPKSVDCWNCCQVAPVNKPVQAPCKQTRFRLHLQIDASMARKSPRKNRKRRNLPDSCLRNYPSLFLWFWWTKQLYLHLADFYPHAAEVSSLRLPELLGAATSIGSSTRAKGSSGKDGSDNLQLCEKNDTSWYILHKFQDLPWFHNSIRLAMSLSA